MTKRRRTKVINIGGVKIGGKNPVRIQSMTNTQTLNVKATVRQILELEKVGCEIVRVGVPDFKSAEAIKEIKKKIHAPLVADIHFNPQLAIVSIENGADKIRINPGNIKDREGLAELVRLAKRSKIPIRIGVNSGSLAKEILEKYKGKVTIEALVESALKSIKFLENLNFYNIVLSLKATDVLTTIEAYKIISRKVDYPLHLGVTEAGRAETGIVKSALGIGVLLLEGIGDTIRVSLSGDPKEEIKIGLEILKNLKLREGLLMISCPTCARTKIEVEGIERFLETIIPLEVQKQEKKIVIMGCTVNGIGESKDADLGIVGINRGEAGIFKKGKLVKKIKEKDLKKYLKREVKSLSKKQN